MKKTFMDLYKEFFSKVGWDYKTAPIADSRPAVRPYIDFIKNSNGTDIYIENGIVLYLDDGTAIIYVGSDK